MRKTSALLALFFLILMTSAAPGGERHIKATLVPVDGSGVSGFVQLTQLPGGGTNIVVVAKGLQPGTVYTSFYYDSDDCTAPSELFGSFTADGDGDGHFQGKIDDDIDEVGSVSVRLGPDYGTLLGCAKVH